MPLKPHLLLVWTLLFAVSTSAYAQDDVKISQADRQAFKELYQGKIDAAVRSRSTEDDRELVQQMLSIADQIPDDPGIQCLIYIEAIPLSLNSGELASMQDAVDKLSANIPSHPNTKLENLVKLAEDAYKSARRDERGPIAEIYLQMLIDQIAINETRLEYREALTNCRKAGAVARAVGSPKEKQIEQTQQRVSAQYDLAKRIDQLTQSLDRNPQNAPAARELVDLLLIKKDDPAAAAKFAPMTGDKRLQTALELAAAGMEAASPQEAARVGDWYSRIAQKQDDDRDAARLLGHARAWYAHFLTVYEDRDALMLQVNASDKAAKLRLAQLDKSDGWIDLIERVFDPRKHSLRPNALAVRDGNIYTKNAVFVLPVYPKNAYDLRVELTVTGGDEDRAGLVIYFPMRNKSGGTLRYNFAGEQALSLEGTGKGLNISGRRSDVFKRVELLIQARPTGGDAVEIKILMDGKLAITWAGRFGQLENPDYIIPPEQFGNAINMVVGKSVTTEIHAIDLREVSE